MIRSHIFRVLMLLIMISTFCSCQKEPVVNNPSASLPIHQNTVHYQIDTATSSIEWKGYKTNENQITNHFGKISFSQGALIVADGVVLSGFLVANLNSITNEDLEDDALKNAELIAHLHSKDFLDTQNFPTATYQIVRTHDGSGDYNTTLEGNLVIKGITHPLSINANIALSEDSIALFSEPTDFSSKAYQIGLHWPENKGVIQDKVTLHIVIKGKKKS